MASPIITPMPVQTDTSYRPISRLAVVGLLLSIPSVFIFTSDNLFWVLLAIILPAFVMCLVAWRTIRNSEGNLAGEAMALVGIVISVACGLGWLTMTGMSKYIMESEARVAIDEWLNKLEHQEAGAAFLLTVDAKYRRLDFNPEEHAKLRKVFPGEQQQTSQFDNFLVEPVTGQVLRYGQQAKLTYGGLVESESVRESQVFRFRYALSSPINEGFIVIAARAQEVMTDEGVRRDWKMHVDGNASYLRNTAYGEQLRIVTERARDELERFIIGLANPDEVPMAIAKFDPQRTGELQTVIGYIRPKGHTGFITPIALLKPIRLRSDKLSNGTWTLVFDCTTTMENDRGVDFSVTVEANEADLKKMKLQDCRFLGMRKLMPTNAGPEGLQRSGKPSTRVE